MVTRYFFKNILTNEKSHKNITFNYQFPNIYIYVRYVIIRNIRFNLNFKVKFNHKHFAKRFKLKCSL